MHREDFMALVGAAIQSARFAASAIKGEDTWKIE